MFEEKVKPLTKHVMEILTITYAYT